MARIVVDPVTRIEGHLRIEAQVEGGAISDAWSSGTMFRGLELVVRNRDPREAWYWLQRICSVCTVVHALASVRAVEDALQIEVPDNARIVRNLIAAAQLVQDHVVHFYHLQALDWVDVASAIKADPVKTAQIAGSLSEWPKSGASHFKAIQTRVRTLVESGQLSLFSNGYWGHPAYRLPPEVNLLAVSHYLDALEFQRDYIRIHAVLGGKNPHLQTFLVGGMSTAMDPDSPQAPLNPERLQLLRTLIEMGQQFVRQVYVPDVLAIAGLYPDWFTRGEGVGNFLAYGCYPAKSMSDPSSFFFPGGVVRNRDLTVVHPFSSEKVTECVSRSWYAYDDNKPSKHPFEGETKPTYTGPAPPYEFLNVDQKYSWLKAPRYENEAMELGPLARFVIAYAAGKQPVKGLVDATLAQIKQPPAALFSTLGRIAARALEAQVVGDKMTDWLNELSDNLGRGVLAMHNGARWDPSSWPSSCRGFGQHEAPRGALGHWVEIEDGAIRNYQVIAPSTWNGGPRDATGQHGPYEAALLKHPVADPDRPLEILRTIHSFDPCLACAVHLIDARGRRWQPVKAT
ncbi:MAG: nickel-dependent hydrogenase large subunit [Bryobacteraceae bacterium]|nr:nickel-dependent hydrogenase large subunit [Bryobacteraceae bacterium]